MEIKDTQKQLMETANADDLASFASFEYWLSIAGKAIQSPKLHTRERLRFSIQVLALLADHNRMPEKQPQTASGGEKPSSEQFDTALQEIRNLAHSTPKTIEIVRMPTVGEQAKENKTNLFNQLAENATRRRVAEEQSHVAQEASSSEVGE